MSHVFRACVCYDQLPDVHVGKVQGICQVYSGHQVWYSSTGLRHASGCFRLYVNIRYQQGEME